MLQRFLSNDRNVKIAMGITGFLLLITLFLVFLPSPVQANAAGTGISGVGSEPWLCPVCHHVCAIGTEITWQGDLDDPYGLWILTCPTCQYTTARDGMGNVPNAAAAQITWQQQWLQKWHSAWQATY